MKKQRASPHPWSAGVESRPLEKLSVKKQKKKKTLKQTINTVRVRIMDGFNSWRRSNESDLLIADTKKQTKVWFYLERKTKANDEKKSSRPYTLFQNGGK